MNSNTSSQQITSIKKKTFKSTKIRCRVTPSSRLQALNKADGQRNYFQIFKEDSTKLECICCTEFAPSYRKRENNGHCLFPSDNMHTLRKHMRSEYHLKSVLFFNKAEQEKNDRNNANSEIHLSSFSKSECIVSLHEVNLEEVIERIKLENDC